MPAPAELSVPAKAFVAGEYAVLERGEPALVLAIDLRLRAALRELPGRAVEFRSIRSGSTEPSTTIPYFGSGSVIEWPPTTATPAFAAASIPPCRTRPSMSSGRSSTGQFTMLSPRNGVPPIA